MMGTTHAADGPVPRKATLLLFFDRGDASYIRSDLHLLAGPARVVRHSFRTRGRYSLPAVLLGQLMFCLRRMGECNAVFVHFAGWNALIPLALARLFGKRSVLFVHGSDAVSMPEIGYGQFRKWPLSWATACALRLARRLVAVDGSLLRSTNHYSGSIVRRQGVLHHVPDLRTPSSVLPHGFAPEAWPIGRVDRDIDLLTVGGGLSSARVRAVKGVDLVIALARARPDLRVAVVGMSGPVSETLPTNLLVVPEVGPEALRAFYHRAKCYAQLSRSEGFGCALAEAMLSGCVPVVSNVGAMPTIVGDTGKVVDAPEVASVEMALRKALIMADTGDGRRARERVVQCYPMDARRRGLVELLT